MANGLQIKRGSGAPVAGAVGSNGVYPFELAYDYTNNKLYINDGQGSGNGNMQEIGGLSSINNSNWSGTDLAVANGGTGASSFTSNSVLTGNGTSAIQAESNLTFDGTTLQVNNRIHMDGTSPFIRIEESGVTNTPEFWVGVDGGNFSIRLNNSGTYPLQIFTNSDNNAVDNINLGYNTVVQGSVTANSLDISGDIDVDGTANFDAIDLDGNLDMRADDPDASRFIHLPRSGGITFYGDGSPHHGIFSRNDSNTNNQDDILISSYGAIYFDLDSNNNNTSNASFEIGKHNTANDPIFMVDGETGHVGINENSLDADLHITGSPVVLKMERAGTRALRMGVPDNSSDFVFADSDDLKSNQRLELTGGGDVYVVNDLGVGTASPSYKLDVDGDIRAQDGHVFYGDSTSGVLSTGSWSGDLVSGQSYERVCGLSHDGGEFVIVEKGGRVGTLIDGSYFAYEAGSGEGGGFYSSSNSSYGAAYGFEASGGSVVFQAADESWSNPVLEIRNTASSAGSGASLVFGHSQGGDTTQVARIESHLLDGSSNRAGNLEFWTSRAGTPELGMQLQSNNYLRLYQQGDTSDYAEFYVTDERVNYHNAHGSGHKFFTDHGNIDIGPMNTGGCHIYTDRAQFFFNKRLTIGVTSGEALLQSYGDQNIEIRRAQGTADRIVIEADQHSHYVNSTKRLETKADGIYVNGISKASSYFQAESPGTLLRLYNSSWGNATTHDVLYNSYSSNFGDAVYLKTSGNSTNNHGIIVVADSYIFMGRDNLTTGALDNSATAPISDVYCRIDTSGNALFDGDVTAFSGDIASDIKLKKNVEDLNYGLKDVLNIRPVSFDWKEKRNGKHDIGFIAQEIEKIIPEVVSEVDTLNSEEKHKTVDYAKLTSVLIKAVQEQQEQINELKEKLNG